jgi:Fic family protein
VRGGQDRPGELRDVQNWIGTSDDIREAKFVPPPVVQMRDALDRLAGYFEQHDELPPIVRVAVCHYQFEAIHPFRDGNGRIGRLLIILLLLRWKLLPNSLLYLSAYLEREREVYYRLLLDVSRKGNWHDWINFFVRGVAEQSKDAAERVKRLQALQAKWKQLMEKDATKAMMMTCDSLFIKPHFTLPDLSKRLGISYNTARSAADRLAKLGILTAFPFPRYKAYAALDISAIVQSSQVIQ